MLTEASLVSELCTDSGNASLLSSNAYENNCSCKDDDKAIMKVQGSLKDW